MAWYGISYLPIVSEFVLNQFPNVFQEYDVFDSRILPWKESKKLIMIFVISDYWRNSLLCMLKQNLQFWAAPRPDLLVQGMWTLFQICWIHCLYWNALGFQAQRFSCKVKYQLEKNAIIWFFTSSLGQFSVCCTYCPLEFQEPRKVELFWKKIVWKLWTFHDFKALFANHATLPVPVTVLSYLVDGVNDTISCSNICLKLG